MTDKKKTQGDEEDKAEGGVSYTMWIEYRPAPYLNGYREDLAQTADAKLHAAYTTLTHLEGLFTLLECVDGEKLKRFGAETVETVLENIGALGRGIAVAAYVHVEEARHTLPV